MRTRRSLDPKDIKVGVFPLTDTDPRSAHYNPSRKGFTAYSTWYNPEWKGCCEHTVSAVNGTEAKKLAIQEHKERCLPDAEGAI